jgi:hypothetical protein
MTSTVREILEVPSRLESNTHFIVQMLGTKLGPKGNQPLWQISLLNKLENEKLALPSLIVVKNTGGEPKLICVSTALNVCPFFLFTSLSPWAQLPCITLSLANYTVAMNLRHFLAVCIIDLFPLQGAIPLVNAPLTKAHDRSECFPCFENRNDKIKWNIIKNRLWN